MLVHRYIVTSEFLIIVQTNEPNKKIRTDSKSVEHDSAVKENYREAAKNGRKESDGVTGA